MRFCSVHGGQECFKHSEPEISGRKGGKRTTWCVCDKNLIPTTLKEKGTGWSVQPEIWKAGFISEMSRFKDWFEIIGFLSLSLSSDSAFLCWFHYQVIVSHILQNWAFKLAPLNSGRSIYLRHFCEDKRETENTSSMVPAQVPERCWFVQPKSHGYCWARHHGHCISVTQTDMK